MSDILQDLRVMALPSVMDGEKDPLLTAGADEIARLRKERDKLHGYVEGLTGLIQLVCARDDIPVELKRELPTNHRVTDAAAYLTQIVPPEQK